jgi:hypothetical protein
MGIRPLTDLTDCFVFFLRAGACRCARDFAFQIIGQIGQQPLPHSESRAVTEMREEREKDK